MKPFFSRYIGESVSSEPKIYKSLLKAIHFPPSEFPNLLLFAKNGTEERITEDGIGKYIPHALTSILKSKEKGKDNCMLQKEVIKYQTAIIGSLLGVQGFKEFKMLKDVLSIFDWNKMIDFDDVTEDYVNNLSLLNTMIQSVLVASSAFKESHLTKYFTNSTKIESALEKLLL